METSSRMMEERFREDDDFRDRMMMSNYDDSRGGGRNDFDNHQYPGRMASQMNMMENSMSMVDGHSMGGRGRMRMTDYDDEDYRFHERMLGDEQISSMSNRMRNEGMMGTNFSSRNNIEDMGTSSKGMMGAMMSSMMSSQGIGGMNTRGSMGGSMGSNPNSSIYMRKSMMGGDTIMSDMNLNMRGRYGVNFNSHMTSKQKSFPIDMMNSESDFGPGFVIGGGGRGQGGFDPDEDSFGGGNTRRSSMSRREAFGGGDSRGFKQSFGGGSRDGGGSWGGRNRGGGGHTTWSS